MMSPGRGQTGIWACRFDWLLDSYLQRHLAVLKGEVAWRVASEGMLMLMFPHPCHPWPYLCLQMSHPYIRVNPSLTFVHQ
jgi:hypothetical protein